MNLLLLSLALLGHSLVVEGIVEKREDKVVEKRGPICLTITGCICKADGTCWYTERCDPPIKVGYCPQNGNKREAAEESVEKREEVEKRAPICVTMKSCNCTPDGCIYVWRCGAPTKVPYCPWPGKKREAYGNNPLPMNLC